MVFTCLYKINADSEPFNDKNSQIHFGRAAITEIEGTKYAPTSDWLKIKRDLNVVNFDQLEMKALFTS